MAWLLLLLIIAAAVVAVLIYNRLVGARNGYQNAFAQIGVQLKRRHDLIPNLAETAKAYLKHENDTFTQVSEARNQAAALLAAATPENTAALAQAENLLMQALRAVQVQLEAYPELQAAANMRQLAEEIASTENRIAFARQAYNDAVMEYNTLIQMFPHNLIAAQTGHGRPVQTLEFEDAADLAQAPQVSF
ncbi:LemA family protein [Kingella pumchi]|jgi:hypothetical protein|uniref:LemA family protein n=1 Tax=Kingella pumchi TaxID=2779506 RepID=A0ABS9NMV0_9NEIS|nr:LemA family protein [Kingella pumchi]MCG6504119.1 LemA family protein [Kingella pumchi]